MRVITILNGEILDKTIEFGKGEWLVLSHSATGIPNVPIFVRVDNTEDVLSSFLEM